MKFLSTSKKNYHQYCQSGDFQIKPVNHPNPTDLEATRWWTQNAIIVTKHRTRSERRMNTTVSGTDDSGQRHVSQIATSSTTQQDGCPVTTSNQHLTYTTAQLHEIYINLQNSLNLIQFIIWCSPNSKRLSNTAAVVWNLGIRVEIHQVLNS